jgi:hypothetical protein
MFGFECGNGWYCIIYELSEKIEAYNKTLPKGHDPVSATQVKEKYGTLRYYVNFATDEIYDLIDKAEEESSNTCERCGCPGKLECDRGWYFTTCPACDKK